MDLKDRAIMNASVLEQTAVISGWIGFVFGSISFYPQIYQNYTRKSVDGLSLNYLAFNIFCWICALIYNSVMGFTLEAVHQYSQRNPGSAINIAFNDIIFDIHSLIVLFLVLFQILYYSSSKRPEHYNRKRGEISRITIAVILCLMLVIMIPCMIILTKSSKSFLVLDCMYIVSCVQFVLVFIKFTPQIYLNYQTKSTKGWSINNSTLDLISCVFSLAQLFILTGISMDWKSIYLNPLKLGIALISIFFDLIFMYQHFVLYRKPRYVLKAMERKGDDLIIGYSRKAYTSNLV